MNAFRTLLVSGMLLSSSAAADQVRESLQHYSVQADSIPELIRALDHHGPRDSENTPRWALTRYELRWTYRYQKTAEQCRAAPLNVDLDLELVLPRWQNLGDVDGSLAHRWSLVRDALHAHEQGHARIARQCAKELSLQLSWVREGPDCAAVGEALTQTGRKMLAQCRQRQAVYDRETDFGRPWDYLIEASPTAKEGS